MNEDFDRARRDQTQFRIYRYEEPIAKSLLDENPFGWALREIERKHERDIDRMRAGNSKPYSFIFIAAH
ncbi:hypothetical protein PV326_003580 [Microctonus aethiopoides]|nr:hypothetical protein PV326_003580 [Microctonus aethiopoides]